MLYLVSTPIGSLNDITLRALDVLKSVDMIYCEDTRVSRKLLKQFDIKKPLKTYHDHSHQSDREGIIAQIKEGQSVALISDAGSPLIADPGFKLIRSMQESKLPYTVVPGASSVIAALQLSGLPTDQFYFAGFLPTKKKNKEDALQSLLRRNETIVCFETAKRITQTLETILLNMPGCHVSIVREITKLYEEVITGSAKEVHNKITDTPLKGEIVLCFKPVLDTESFDEKEMKKKIAYLAGYMGLKEASDYLSKETGLSKKQLYQLGLDT